VSVPSSPGAGASRRNALTSNSAPAPAATEMPDVMKPTEADITARVEAIRQRFPSPAALQQALATTGISEPVIRIFAEDDLSLAAYLDERFSAAAQPTDQEVLQAGEANRRKLADERRRTLISAWVAELRRRADISLLQ